MKKDKVYRKGIHKINRKARKGALGYKLLWLRRWFVIHFIVDLSVALPLFFAPGIVLNFFGMENGSVALARIVAAALMAIGIESFLGRKAGRETFLGMLRLKIIWSAAVILGLLISLLNKDIIHGGFLLGIFIFFNCVWVYWFLKLSRQSSSKN